MKARYVLIVLLIALLTIIPTAIVYMVLEGWYHFPIIAVASAIIIGIMLAGLLGCLVLYDLRTVLIPSGMEPETAIRRIEYHLRGIGYGVDKQGKNLIVRLDQNRTARIKVQPSAQGSELSVYPGLTPGGLALTFFLCFFLPFCGIGALAMAYGSERRTSQFCSGVLGPTVIYLENMKEGQDGGPQTDLKWVIINTLQQADRQATEALLALRSSYADSSWLTVALGMLAYVVFFLTLGTNKDGPGGLSLSVNLSVLALLLTIVVVAGLIWRFRRLYHRRSNDLRTKIWDLRAAISREQGAFPTTDGDETGLGTILRMWPEIPKWAKYRRRNFFQRNPVISTVIAGMLLFAFQAGYYGSLGGMIFLGLALASVALYIWTKIGNVRSDRRMLQDWNAKIEALSSKIDSKLREL